MDKVKVNNRLVGYVDGTDFIKHVTPKNMFYKYQSWTITKSTVLDLLNQGVDRIILEYKNGDIQYKMWLPIKEFLLIGVEYVKEDEKRIRVHKSKWYVEDQHQTVLGE